MLRFSNSWLGQEENERREEKRGKTVVCYDAIAMACFVVPSIAQMQKLDTVVSGIDELFGFEQSKCADICSTTAAAPSRPSLHPSPHPRAFHTHYLIAWNYSILALALSISCLPPFLPLCTVCVCLVSVTSDGSIWSLLIFHTIRLPNNGTALIVDNLLLMAISAVRQCDNGGCVACLHADQSHFSCTS